MFGLKKGRIFRINESQDMKKLSILQLSQQDIYKTFEMKLIKITALLILIFSNCTTNKGLSVNSQKVKSAKAFLYNINESYTAEEIIVDGKLNTSVLQAVDLTKKQAKSINTIIHADTKFIEGIAPIPPATCFFPRHGIVFYGQYGEHLFFISICFECNQMITSTRMEIENIYALQLIKDIILKTELPIFRNIEQYIKYLEKE